VAFVKRGDAADGRLSWGQRDARRKQFTTVNNNFICKS
jgi:hypothetical protein